MTEATRRPRKRAALVVSAVGCALGHAACEAAEAYRALIRVVLALEGAGMEFSEEVVEVVEAVGEMASGLIDIADGYGRREVPHPLRSAA
jgi:hypothetical protein